MSGPRSSRAIPGAAARGIRAAVLVSGWLGAGCTREPASPPPDLPAVAGQVSLLRFPRGGGIVQAYHPDSLTPVGWSSHPVPPIRQVLGADLDDRLLWAVDAKDSLVGIDLETRAVRKRLARVGAATVGPDGSLYLAEGHRRIVRFVRREAARFHDTLPAPARALFAAVNDQVIAVVGPPAQLITSSADQTIHSIALPAGDIAATQWGDLVAVAGDSGVTLYETGGPRGHRSVPSLKEARRIGFSPSGHRLFVSQTESRIRVFDRFTLRELGPIALPGRPREFRVDDSGRWLLVHREAGDSIWVMDLTTGRQVASVLAEWSRDLPMVAGSSRLIIRQGEDAVAIDLREIPAREAGRVVGGGADHWLAVRWVPPERVPAALAALDSAQIVQDSGLVASLDPGEERRAADSTRMYLQVSRTQNPEWASLLVKQLQSDGYPASVLDPVEPEDGYRVVVGPYPSREVADSIGRRLGRAYFLLRLPPQGT